MNPFPVYPLFDIQPIKGEGAWIWDDQGRKFLDFYGGHAVISIGHSHPHFVQGIQEQLQRLAFYSNSVQNHVQKEFALKLGNLSGYPDYDLFLVNSGAEAMENALKLAAFHTNRTEFLALKGAFHGRTTAALSITDNPRIRPPFCQTSDQIPLNDIAALEQALASKKYAALIIEGIQGIGGIHMPSDEFLQVARACCTKYGTILILDEIQSGYGRTGKFFAHQYSSIKADLICVAKGMGNGFPIGGLLVSPAFEARMGLLGTTFGGNHLACAAGLAVLEVIESENLIEKAFHNGNYLMEALQQVPTVQDVRGKGLMIGISVDESAKDLRMALLNQHRIFTGSASDPHTLRLLPPLTINHSEMQLFLQALQTCLLSIPNPQ